MSSSGEKTLPDRTKEEEKNRKRKDSESDNSMEWPRDVGRLQMPLKEMNEEEEKTAMDTPADTPISEIQTHQRNCQRRKTVYSDMIAQVLSRHQQNVNSKARQREDENVLELARRAQVELRLQLYIKEQRSSTQQSASKDKSANHYGVERMEDAVKEYGCVVAHIWSLSKHFKAAHLMPVRLRQLSMRHIFGQKATEESFYVENGLILEIQIEICFDKCPLTIVPSLSEEGAMGAEGYG
ncbi:hypothetical protein NHQ30_009670 [Ciborinia camelliae]|nr:hypothetical protein NHQ30_009670 [Ciborinia camelliae]